MGSSDWRFWALEALEAGVRGGELGSFESGLNEAMAACPPSVGGMVKGVGKSEDANWLDKVGKVTPDLAVGAVVCKRDGEQRCLDWADCEGWPNWAVWKRRRIVGVREVGFYIALVCI